MWLQSRSLQGVFYRGRCLCWQGKAGRRLRVTELALGMNYWCLLSVMYIIASIPWLPLKLMKSWLRPAYLWKGLGLVLGMCCTGESHGTLTKHTDTLFFRFLKNKQSLLMKDSGWRHTRSYTHLTAKTLSCT